MKTKRSDSQSQPEYFYSSLPDIPTEVVEQTDEEMEKSIEEALRRHCTAHRKRDARRLREKDLNKKGLINTW